jgi:hypothetical protein
MFIIWYKKIKIKVNHIVAGHTGVYIYLVTTAGVFKYDPQFANMWKQHTYTCIDDSSMF